ncbi:MAG: T9SS type A sorting domain-containing protein [Bacteroidota bacterium]
MKRTGIIFIIYAFTILNCKAQPNGSFENWTTVFSIPEPDGWQTPNFLSLLSPPNPLSAFKVTGLDVHSGNYALKLKTVYLNNKPPQLLVNDSSGGTYIGKIVFSPLSSTQGFPYTERPEKLQFWARYIPVGNDIGKAGVLLKKWNISDFDTIAYSLIEIPPTPVYTLFEVDINYFSSEAPDSAVIAFATSKNAGTSRVNSTLYLDDIQFSNAVGIAEGLTEYRTSAYPNPATDNVTIYAENKDADNVQLVDINDKLAGVYKLQNNYSKINTSLFASGTYIYTIRDNKERNLFKGQFKVVK